MCASYTESYQSYEVIIVGTIKLAFEPYARIGYETGNWDTGCACNKCPNGYISSLTSISCKQGHYNTSNWASGWGPACPHGYAYSGKWHKAAHCEKDAGYNSLGYHAPCGRTTHREDDTYGYVTRTRTTSYNKEAGCLSSTLYDVNDAAISTPVEYAYCS